MWHSIVGLWRRMWRTVRVHRSVHLSVTPLEVRATPAATEALLAPVQPPTVIVFVSVPLPSAMTHDDAGIVRSDLFGAGDTGRHDEADEWEQVLADDPTHAEAPIVADDVKPDDSVATEDVGTMLFEQPAFVPPME
ncbi:MAG: hypothetical protein FJ303_04380 [Planctomycetes bacterium]|nr:hypothetical protein [Planctomycetota bacterium]